MRNYIQSGDTLTVTCPAGGLTSGAGVLVGALFGVAVTNAAENQPVPLVTRGVVELPKLATAVLNQADVVAWDAANKRCDVPGTGKAPIGVAAATAGNGAATVQVRLDGVATATA